MIRRLGAMAVLALATIACTSDEVAGPAGVGSDPTAVTSTNSASTSVVRHHNIDEQYEQYEHDEHDDHDAPR